MCYPLCPHRHLESGFTERHVNVSFVGGNEMSCGLSLLIMG